MNLLFQIKNLLLLHIMIFFTTITLQVFLQTVFDNSQFIDLSMKRSSGCDVPLHLLDPGLHFFPPQSPTIRVTTRISKTFKQRLKAPNLRVFAPFAQSRHRFRHHFKIFDHLRTR
ncbi:hypothetical protein Hanom_Chr07g00680301 [Helianthus anomalus]